jgi:pimeloyl-ACP methyl ester carboxylesterase
MKIILKIKLQILFLLLALLTVYACGSNRRAGPPTFPRLNDANLPSPTLAVEIPQLSNCTDENDRILKLNTTAPVILLVHGCDGSAGNFYTLADVFAFHGQQTVCFNYNDQDSMRVSADQLGQAIAMLVSHLNPPDIIIIGHSQGGLIAHRTLAMAQDGPPGWRADARLRLVTISAPFAGIDAARHCGSTALHILSLGLTVPICWAISGDKWYEITSASDFIRRPGALPPAVGGYLKVDTDERGSCRRLDDRGRCQEDDFVFSLAEQYHQRIEADARVMNVVIKAGHAEIIGNEKDAPGKLITVLQERGILAPTPPEERLRLAMVLRLLYRQP